MYAQRFLAVGLAAFAVASAEQAWAEDPPQQPLTEKHDTVESAISTPAEDLNLKKTEIPDVLQRAVVDPYDLRGASNCLDIAAEVARLDLALGTDKDVPTSKTASKENPASVLKAGIEAVIPYRGIIRRITGATAHEKEVQKAVDAGFARRGFLKGRALEMKCPAPAARGCIPGGRVARNLAARAGGGRGRGADGLRRRNRCVAFPVCDAGQL